MDNLTRQVVDDFIHSLITVVDVMVVTSRLRNLQPYSHGICAKKKPLHDLTPLTMLVPRLRKISGIIKTVEHDSHLTEAIVDSLSKFYKTMKNRYTVTMNINRMLDRGIVFYIDLPSGVDVEINVNCRDLVDGKLLGLGLYGAVHYKPRWDGTLARMSGEYKALDFKVTDNIFIQTLIEGEAKSRRLVIGASFWRNEKKPDFVCLSDIEDMGGHLGLGPNQGVGFIVTSLRRNMCFFWMSALTTSAPRMNLC